MLDVQKIYEVSEPLQNRPWGVSKSTLRRPSSDFALILNDFGAPFLPRCSALFRNREKVKIVLLRKQEPDFRGSDHAEINAFSIDF